MGLWHGPPRLARIRAETTATAVKVVEGARRSLRKVETRSSRSGGQRSRWCEDGGTSTRKRRKKTSSDETVQWHGSVVVRQSAVTPASVVCRYHEQDTRPTECLAAKTSTSGARGQAAATKPVVVVVAAWTCPRVGGQRPRQSKQWDALQR